MIEDVSTDHPMPAGTDAAVRLSIVIPCLDEAGTIEECVRGARHALDSNGIAGEVIVADNGSSDGSGALAEAAGAHVVYEPERGYGSAYLAGLAAARGDYILMADADLTYDFEEAPHFLAELEGGADMVIGNRMKNIHPGAMPWHHRYIGNPLLSGLPQRAVQHRASTTRTAACAHSAATFCRARPAHDRNGVRLRDGDPRRQGEA